MTKLSLETLDEVAQFVNERNGRHVTLKQVADYFNVAANSIGKYLTELSKLGLITVSGSTHVRTYSKVMPVQEVTPPEPLAARGVLKVDRHRIALYAELAAARAAIPSIG